MPVHSEPSAARTECAAASWNLNESLKVMVLSFCLQTDDVEMRKERPQDAEGLVQKQRVNGKVGRLDPRSPTA